MFTVEVELEVVPTLYVSYSLNQYKGAVISTDTNICLRNFRCSEPPLIKARHKFKSFPPQFNFWFKCGINSSPTFLRIAHTTNCVVKPPNFGIPKSHNLRILHYGRLHLYYVQPFLLLLGMTIVVPLELVLHLGKFESNSDSLFLLRMR